MKPDKNRARGIGFYLLIGVIILAVIFYLTTPAEQKEYTYSEIEELFRQEQVKSFCLEGDELTLNLYSPDSDGNTTIKKTLSNPTWFREDLGDLIEQQTASGVLTEYDYVKGWTAPWWMSILPYLITIVLFIGVWYLLMNKAGGGGAPGVGKFGKVTVNKFMLHYAAAGDDPYDTVVTYNYVNAALSTLIPICEEKFIVKDSDIRTDIDFTADKTKVDVELCATIRLAQVMHMLFAIAFGALGVLIRNKRRLRREKKQGIASDGIEVDVALDKDTDETETSHINKDNNTEQNTQAEERTDSNGQ